MKLLTKASPDGGVSQRERENRQVAYQAACEGMVLLKNDGALPLRTKKVALYGSGASRTIKGGSGAGEVNERHAVTILEGLRDRGFEITTQRWIADFEREYAAAGAAHQARRRNPANFLGSKAIIEMMDGFRAPCGPAITGADVEESATDACIYVLSRQAGERSDRRVERGDLLLSGEEEEAIRFCAEKYAHFVLVINSGSALDMAFLEHIPGINAILYLCQPGGEGGSAFADVIGGKVSPSGKLADTWAWRYEDFPFAGEYSYLNGDLRNEFYQEGIYVGYRFFDSFGVDRKSVV